jgi:hypothetical protein
MPPREFSVLEYNFKASDAKLFVQQPLETHYGSMEDAEDAALELARMKYRNDLGTEEAPTETVYGDVDKMQELYSQSKARTLRPGIYIYGNREEGSMITCWVQGNHAPIGKTIACSAKLVARLAASIG